MTALLVEDLRVQAKKTTLLGGIDLRVEPGEWVSVIGPNGAGKSTLLRAVAGVIRSQGRLTIDGHDADSLDARARARLVSWVPQSPTIPPGLPLFDYVLLGRTPHVPLLGSEDARDLEVTRRVIADLDLERFAARAIDTLSGGERQRAVIARALAQEAPIMLLDEPTSALDLGHQQELLGLLERLRTAGDHTIVTTMHDLTLAGAFADRLVMLACGEAVARGSAREVLTQENLERIYGAQVHVQTDGDRVVVVPQLAIGRTND